MTDIIIVSGSQRDESQTAKVSGFLASRWSQLRPGSRATVLDLHALKIPMLDDGFWEKDHPTWAPLWTPWAERLERCAGIILVTPEWNGMATAAVMNFLLLLKATQVGHKPALLVSVSAGMSGPYPITQLRAYGYKNTRLCMIPEHLIIRFVERVLNGEATGAEAAGLTADDQFIRTRIDYALKVFSEYAKALALVRSSGVIDHKNFVNGM